MAVHRAGLPEVPSVWHHSERRGHTDHLRSTAFCVAFRREVTCGYLEGVELIILLARSLTHLEGYNVQGM